MLDRTICERARLARDARFDGLFFTGVISTGIFCRPICPAPAPSPKNVHYYPTAAAAASAGLRPCLRCRPEAAPGTPAWNGTSATAARAVRLIQQGALNDEGVESLAARLGVGARHLRRLFKQYVGVSPIAMASLQRVLFGKKLLAETQLRITDIAYASGFGSIRRFNAAFQAVYHQSPSALRRKLNAQRDDAAIASGFQCTLTLPYRPPYQWHHILAFFRDRAIDEVEFVDGNAYQRTIRYDGIMGKMRVSHAPSGHALILQLQLSDLYQLMQVVQKVRRMFDLDANMPTIAATLVKDEKLGPLIERLPGLPLPGSWDPFETAIRAIVGQQITVKAARTILNRIVTKAGPQIAMNGNTEAMRFFPEPQEFDKANLAGVGLPVKRIETLKTMAGAILSGKVELAAHYGLSHFVERLIQLPGIGPWTAHYIAMRALNEPDAFPASDLGIVQALAKMGKRPTPQQIMKQAENWRPWRAYAAMYLWNA